MLKEKRVIERQTVNKGTVLYYSLAGVEKATACFVCIAYSSDWLSNFLLELTLSLVCFDMLTKENITEKQYHCAVPIELNSQLIVNVQQINNRLNLVSHDIFECGVQNP